MHATRVVRVTTDLPISADRAFALAHKLSLFEYVVWPVLRFPVSAEQRARAAEGLFIGEEFWARLWFFGMVPAWTHRLRIVADGDLELRTNERSGPVRIWNHRLVFEPLDQKTCRYTDEIEIERGFLGLTTAAFIHVFFRYRHLRWRALARAIA